MPDIPRAAEGRANVLGLVLWNDQPVIKSAVWLCKGEKYSSVECIERQSVNTDRNGYFVFINVIPGTYNIRINSFGLNWWQYLESQTILADQNVILHPWNVYKLDLHVTNPGNGKTISEAVPTFKWDAYPQATYYQVSLYDEKGKWAAQNEIVYGNEFTPAQPLVACKYFWYVEAFNSKGTLISHSAPPNSRSAVMEFNVVNVPGIC
jgi:hypothetical protein